MLASTLALVVFALAAWQDKSIDIPLVGGNGDIAFSDGSLCSTWLSNHDSPDVEEKYRDAQDAYLEGKLDISEALFSERGSVYNDGMLVYCYERKRVGEAFASTDELVSTLGLQEAEDELYFAITSGIAP